MGEQTGTRTLLDLWPYVVDWLLFVDHKVRTSALTLKLDLLRSCDSLGISCPSAYNKQRGRQFVTGRLASLQLGPRAPTLVGARIGAERLSWRIQEFFAEDTALSGAVEAKEDDEAVYNYSTGRSNGFDSLAAASVKHELAEVDPTECLGRVG
jgi:hypothetical protein